MRSRTRRQSVLHGDTYYAAYAHAMLLKRRRGFPFVHPFDDRR